MAMRVAPGQPVANMYDFSNVVLPWDIGQSSIQAYVPDTKHTIRGLMLDYWRATGAAAVYGNPISEPFASPRRAAITARRSKTPSSSTAPNSKGPICHSFSWPRSAVN